MPALGIPEQINKQQPAQLNIALHQTLFRLWLLAQQEKQPWSKQWSCYEDLEEGTCFEICYALGLSPASFGSTGSKGKVAEIQLVFGIQQKGWKMFSQILVPLLNFGATVFAQDLKLQISRALCSPLEVVKPLALQLWSSDWWWTWWSRCVSEAEFAARRFWSFSGLMNSISFDPNLLWTFVKGITSRW